MLRTMQIFVPVQKHQDRNKNTGQEPITGTVKTCKKEHVFWGFGLILFLFIETFMQNQPEKCSQGVLKIVSKT